MKLHFSNEWLKRMLDTARDHPDDPEGCRGCGLIAGCCEKYPNCPGNPDWENPAKRGEKS